MKQHGMFSVEQNNREFIDEMRRQARRIATRRGVVTSDDLHAYADRRGMSPTHPNAFGAIFRSGFNAVGFRVSERPAARHRVIREWQVA